jgi:hypothetical protein
MCISHTHSEYRNALQHPWKFYREDYNEVLVADVKNKAKLEHGSELKQKI